MTNMEWAFDYQNFDRSIVFKKKNHPTNNCAASVEEDSEYRRVVVNIYPSFFEGTLEIQRGYLIHEFCHTFTHKLSDKAIILVYGKLDTHDCLTSTIEEATSRIAQIVGTLLDGRMTYARKGYSAYVKVGKKKKK